MECGSDDDEDVLYGVRGSARKLKNRSVLSKIVWRDVATGIQVRAPQRFTRCLVAQKGVPCRILIMHHSTIALCRNREHEKHEEACCTREDCRTKHET